MLFPLSILKNISEPHLLALFSYIAFMSMGTLLALVRQWYKPKSSEDAYGRSTQPFSY
jgi:hypothetical protein